VHYYEESSKSFHTFIFSKRIERGEGWGWEGIVGCHVTSQQDKPVDLAVSVRVAMGCWTWQQNLKIAERSSNDLLYVFLWAEVVPGGQIHQRMCAQYGNSALL
jgi:hypothetical protein